VVAPAEAVGGRYCEDCHVAEVVDEGPIGDSPSGRGSLIRGGVRRYAMDPEHAKALWALSEEMVGERF
jgi:hypothetical protein